MGFFQIPMLACWTYIFVHLLTKTMISFFACGSARRRCMLTSLLSLLILGFCRFFFSLPRNTAVPHREGLGGVIIHTHSAPGVLPKMISMGFKELQATASSISIASPLLNIEYVACQAATHRGHLSDGQSHDQGESLGRFVFTSPTPLPRLLIGH